MGQEYEDMAEQLDYICPMIYPSHYGPGNFGIEYPDTQPYDTILNTLNGFQELLAASAKGGCAAGIGKAVASGLYCVYLERYIKYGDERVRAADTGCLRAAAMTSGFSGMQGQLSLRRAADSGGSRGRRTSVYPSQGGAGDGGGTLCERRFRQKQSRQAFVPPESAPAGNCTVGERSARDCPAGEAKAVKRHAGKRKKHLNIGAI